MLRKYLLIILMLSLMVVPVQANPITDFFRRLFGIEEEKIIINENQILSSKSEQICSNGVCNWIGYSKDIFEQENGEWKTFNQVLKKGELNNNKTLVFEFNGGEQLRLIPFGVVNKNKIFYEDLSQQQKDNLNFDVNVSRGRDNTKFTLTFNKINQLDYLGLKLESNFPISKREYNYTPSGTYSDNIPRYEMIDLIVKNRKISFTDLIDSGYNVTFNISEREMYIDLRDKPNGLVIADPSISLSSLAHDGTKSIDEFTAACTYKGTFPFISVGDSHSATDTNFEGLIDFDTKTIPDTAIIIGTAQVGIFANTFVISGSHPDPTNYTSNIKLNNTFGINPGVPCNTNFLINLTPLYITNETPGWFNLSFDGSLVSKTTNTSFEYTSTWLHVGAGEDKFYGFDSSEGTNSPYLNVSYTIGVTNITWTEPTPDDLAILKGNRSVLLNATIGSEFQNIAFLDFNRSLRGYWSFESSNSTGVFGNSSYENFAEFNSTSGSSDIDTSKFGNGFLTRSNGESLFVLDSSDLDITNDEMTLILWFKTDDWDESIPSIRFLIDKRGGPLNNRSYRMFFFGFVDDWRYRMTTTSGTVNCDTEGIKLSKSTWTQLAFVYNSSNMLIYQNSTLVKSCSQTGNITNNDYSLWMAGFNQSSTNFFDGELDEISIHSRAFNQEELNASYNSSKYRLFRNFTLNQSGQYNFSAYAIDLGGFLNISSRSFNLTGYCSDGYLVGQWTITSVVNCTDERDIPVTDNLNITDSGRLNFFNSTAAFDFINNIIYIHNGGILWIENGSKIY